MGNDGGSIPKRRELVKEAVRAQTSAEAKETQQEQHSHAWSTCALSQRPLQPPVVSDYMGTLYNKDAILEYLLPADDAAAQMAKLDGAKVLAGRVAGLKDVVEVHFHEVAGLDGTTPSAGDGATWTCPITDKQLGPGVKAAYIVPCGHAFSEIALKEVAELVCLQCSEPYAASNIVTILPLKAEDKARLQERQEKLKLDGLAHSLKKAGGKKKRKHREEVKGDDLGRNGNGNGVASTHKDASAMQPTSSGHRAINNAATASLTAKVLAEEQARAKRRRADPTQSESVRELFSSGGGVQSNGKAASDFMTRGFTIPSKVKR